MDFKSTPVEMQNNPWKGLKHYFRKEHASCYDDVEMQNNPWKGLKRGQGRVKNWRESCRNAE